MIRPKKVSCWHLFILMLLLAGWTAGCGGQATRTPPEKLTVTVSILPQKYFVERVGGEHVSVNVMVGPGADPHTYEPRPEQMRALSKSMAYFTIGIEFERAWLEKFTAANPNMQVVDTLEGVERLAMMHAHEGEEHDEEVDPHVWTSPVRVKIMAHTIYQTLTRLDPEHRQTYKANLDAFLADVDTLDADIRNALSGLKTRKFMVFHPSWGYFAHDYGLEQIAIEVGGQEPSAQELAAIIAQAHQEGIRVILAQPEFSTRAAETIAREIGGEVLLISPLAPDWLDNMRQVAETFAEVLNR